MPARNAAKTLEATVSGIPRGWVDEIILVDDSSTDDTVELARKLPLHVVWHPHNVGYGGNQKTCYLEALQRDADVVVMLHPDGQYEPGIIPRLVEPIVRGEADIVLGSRFLEPGGAVKGGMPWWKRAANRGLTTAENRLMGTDLSELHTGYRAFSRQVLLEVPFLRNSLDFAFDTELLMQASHFGFRFHEVPCATIYNNEASSVSFRQGVVYGVKSLWAGARLVLHRRRIWRSQEVPEVRRVCVFSGSSPGARPRVPRRRRATSATGSPTAGSSSSTAARSVGLMGALADAALEGGGRVTGVIPQSLVDREIAHPGLSDLRVVDSMHERKAQMAELADAFVALPGGVGTLEELFEVYTWNQLGLHAKPLGLFNVRGYFDGLVRFLDHAVGGALRDARAPRDAARRRGPRRAARRPRGLGGAVAAEVDRSRAELTSKPWPVTRNGRGSSTRRRSSTPAAASSSPSSRAPSRSRRRRAAATSRATRGSGSRCRRPRTPRCPRTTSSARSPRAPARAPTSTRSRTSSMRATGRAASRCWSRR